MLLTKVLKNVKMYLHFQYIYCYSITFTGSFIFHKSI
jgi:hypothetical protein